MVSLGKDGFTVSKSQGILTIGLFIFIVVAVGLMAGLIRRPCPKEAVDSTKTSTLPPVTTTVSTPSPTTEPTGPEPWYHPFIPSYTIPVHYDLWFYPDFYNDGSIFYGRESLEINVTQDAKYILIHFKMMTINETKLKFKNGKDIPIAEPFAYSRNQYWVVPAVDDIPAGSVVILELKFSGSLVNGIVGYYKSNYTNQITKKQR